MRNSQLPSPNRQLPTPKGSGMDTFARNTRGRHVRHARLIVILALTATALATIPFAAGQQPTGDPFSTEIKKLKDGLYVIPGYDGAVTGGNVAVRVTNEGTIIVDDRLPPSSA